MSKIVYLFGAGASANALPVVNGIPERLENIIKQIGETTIDEEFNEDKTKLIKDLQWLLEGAKRHATIDTFAKKLWLNGGNDSTRLSIALSVFFTVEQILKNPDSRYDTFLASTLQKRNKSIPDNIKILTWNYDSQFEISSKEYNAHFFITEKYHAHNDDENYYQIIKINGSSRLSEGNLCVKYSSLTNDALTEILTQYKNAPTQKGSNFSRLSFAWDKTNRDKLHEQLKRLISDAEVLVIIGYSFPFFNREVDKMIFSTMPKLGKIYIQDLNPEEVEQNMRPALSPIQVAHPSLNRNIIKLPRVDQFYLPAEL